MYCTSFYSQKILKNKMYNLGYTLVKGRRLNKNLEYTKYRKKYIESEYISHFVRK